VLRELCPRSAQALPEPCPSRCPWRGRGAARPAIRRSLPTTRTEFGQIGQIVYKGLPNCPKRSDHGQCRVSVDHELLDLLCRQVLGKPATACDLVDMLHVRDAVDRLLNGEVDRRQADAGIAEATS
jgi:hypothetical protein